MPFDEQFLKYSGPSAYVGLVPAAGVGSRLPALKSSKEMLPVNGARGKKWPVIAHLISNLHRAGVTEVRVIMRQEKQDLADYLAGEEWHHVQFDNRTTRGTSGVPETVALGLDDARDRRIAFGFPDILFEPGDAYRIMMQRLEDSEAEVVLGLFPTDSPGKMDMVAVDQDGRVTDIEIKPKHSSLTLTWIIAVWEPTFSSYLCELQCQNSSRISGHTGNIHLGHIFQLAIADGLQISSASFPQGRALDIGTPDDLERAKSWPG